MYQSHFYTKGITTIRIPLLRSCLYCAIEHLQTGKKDYTAGRLVRGINPFETVAVDHIRTPDQVSKYHKRRIHWTLVYLSLIHI